MDTTQKMIWKIQRMLMIAFTKKDHVAFSIYAKDYIFFVKLHLSENATGQRWEG